MKKAHFTNRAFTLIELLVVIAIIAILTGIILTSLTGSKAKGRDAQRVSDIGQIQLALELYFDRCHVYPLSDGGKIDSTVLNEPVSNNGCVDSSNNSIALNSYISVVQTPPAGATPGQTAYGYVTNNGTAPTDYVLFAILESTNSASTNSLGSSAPSYGQSVNGTAITCNLTTNYCVGPK